MRARAHAPQKGSMAADGGEAVVAVAGEIFGEGLAGERFLLARHLLGGALGDDASAVLAAFRAEVNDPVGIADHVEVVLDDDDGIAQVGKAVKDVEQLFYVVEVQAGGGLVEKVESAAGLALAEFAGQ